TQRTGATTAPRRSAACAAQRFAAGPAAAVADRPATAWRVQCAGTVRPRATTGTRYVDAHAFQCGGESHCAGAVAISGAAFRDPARRAAAEPDASAGRTGDPAGATVARQH